MQPHRIHLKGPWTFEWIDREGETVERAEPQRVQMPVSWREHLGSISGHVRYCRPFGKPTNLDTEEQVHLCFDGIGGRGTLRLNGEELGSLDGPQESCRFEVTSRLQQRNTLIVDLSFDPDESTNEPGGLWGPVALEIA